MKNLLGVLAAVALMATTFTSCNKDDDYNYEEQLEAVRKEEMKIDSLLAQQKIAIENYVDDNFTNAIEDTTKVTFQVLDKKIKRGIWYEIISPATDNTYEYKLNAAQNGVIYPTWKLKYKVNSLTSETPVFSDVEGTNYTLTSATNNNIFTQAWVIALFPAKYKVNGQDINYFGLTKDGQKKGSKIRVIVPSIYAYGNQGLTGKVAANTPLVYEFEIIEIQ